MLPSAASDCHTKRKLSSVVPQMSPPPPWIVQVPADRDWLPGAGATWPISAQFQALGPAPVGATSPALTATESSGTADPVPWLWEVVAIPASSGPGMVSAWVEPGIAVQVLPSGEV